MDKFNKNVTVEEKVSTRNSKKKEKERKDKGL